MKITKPKILNFKFEIDEKSLYLLTLVYATDILVYMSCLNKLKI